MLDTPPPYDDVTNYSTLDVRAATITYNTSSDDILSETTSVELPPAYTFVDENVTTFTVCDDFICTPAGPAYQLSSLLDARVSRLHIRRLRAGEITRLQNGATDISFRSSGILYEIYNVPFTHEYDIQGKHESCLPGFFQLQFGLKRWHVQHLSPNGAIGSQIFTCGKRGPLRRALMERKNEMEPSEWKDNKGRVLATEVLKIVRGEKMPVIELKEDLDQTSRELLLTLWVARLWAAFDV